MRRRLSIASSVSNVKSACITNNGISRVSLCLLPDRSASAHAPSSAVTIRPLLDGARRRAVDACVLICALGESVNGAYRLLFELSNPESASFTPLLTRFGFEFARLYVEPGRGNGEAGNSRRRNTKKARPGCVTSRGRISHDLASVAAAGGTGP